jgi:sugar lactone lactonase YvrE
MIKKNEKKLIADTKPKQMVVPQSFAKNISKSVTAMEKTLTISTVNCPTTILGESPLWCSITKSLIYIDINGKKIYQLRPSQLKIESMSMSQLIGFAVPTADSTSSKLILIVGLEDHVAEVNFTEKRIIRKVAITPITTTYPGRFNDAKCSPKGNLYAGYMNTNWRNGNRGHIFRLWNAVDKSTGYCNLNHVRRQGWEDIHLPNGTVWMDDRIYIVDSGSGTITLYKLNDVLEDFDNDRFDDVQYLETIDTIFIISPEDVAAGGMLDGMTVDDSGQLWVAISGIGVIIR